MARNGNQDEDNSYASQIADHERAVSGERPALDGHEVQEDNSQEEQEHEVVQPTSYERALAITPPPGFLSVEEAETHAETTRQTERRAKRKKNWKKGLVISAAIAGTLLVGAEMYGHTKNIVNGTNDHTISRKVVTSVYDGTKNVSEKIANYAVFNIEDVFGEPWQDQVLVDGEVQKNKDGTAQMKRHKGDLGARVLNVIGSTTDKTWDYAVAEPAAEAFTFYTGKELNEKPSGKQVTPAIVSDIEDTRDAWHWWPFGDEKTEEKEKIVFHGPRRGLIPTAVSKVADGINMLVWGDTNRFSIVDKVYAQEQAKYVKANFPASALTKEHRVGEIDNLSLDSE